MEKRIVMVTGSGMGIGLACAEAFAREGATVIMADIQKPEEQARKLIGMNPMWSSTDASMPGSA